MEFKPLSPSLAAPLIALVIKVNVLNCLNGETTFILLLSTKIKVNYYLG